MTSYVNVLMTVCGFYSNLDTEEKFLLRLKDSTIRQISSPYKPLPNDL